MSWSWISAVRVRLNRQQSLRPIQRRLAAWSLVECLEPRCVLSATAGANLSELVEEHGLDADGNEWHALPTAVEQVESAQEAQTVAGGAPFALAQTFLLHTNPTANHRIYLDFDGHVTSGTSWNSSFTGGADIVTPEYNIDGVAGFSNTELERIQYIWQRVAEDFIPFNVDVTTEAPANLSDLIKSGSGDTRWGVRVCVGGSSYDWYGAGAGGVAYVGSFNWNTDTPTFVFTAQLGNGHEKYTAEAISHEAGHTVGLSHDGRTSPSEGYYQGHGSGETGWAPIMGVGYYQNLSQWSKGEYTSANQLQDDLAIITSQNGFGYRADDYGNTNDSAAAVNLVTATSIDGAGVIERTSDFDVFSLLTGAGAISVNVLEFERGANLDILAELYDSNGALIASANPTDYLEASLNTTVVAGQYFLHISGTGKGDPLTTGYTDYGSLGQYKFTGTIVDPGALPTISVSDASANEDGTLTFTLSLSAAQMDSVAVNFATANGSATAGSDYSADSGTVTFAPGETSKTVTVSLLDDTLYEGNETLSLNLSGPVGAVIADGQGIGTIIDNDPAPLPALSINDPSVNEGGLVRKNGAPKLTNMTFTVTLSATSSQAVTVNYSTGDGSATVANNDYQAKSGTLTFAPGVTSQTLTVVIVGDTALEANETFTVTLSGVAYADIADGSSIGTIVNDDKSGGRPRAPSAGGTESSTTAFTASNTPTGYEVASQNRTPRISAAPTINDLRHVNSESKSTSTPRSESTPQTTTHRASDAAFAAVDDLLDGIAQPKSPSASWSASS